MDPGSYSLLFITLSLLKPFSFSIILPLCSIFVLLALSAMYSSSEVAYFSLSPSQITVLKEDEQNKINQIINGLLNQPARFIATLLISNSAVNIAIVILSTYVMRQAFDFADYPVLGVVINVVLITFIIVMFGDVIPKVYATKNNLKLAVRFAIPLYITHRLFYPFSYLMAGTTAFIEKRMKKISYNVTIDELTHAIDIASDTTTPIEEKKILKGIVKFGNLDVTQIMRPRVDVIAFDMKTPFTELLKKILEAGYSRVPVYDENLDNVKGVLHIKDLLLHYEKGDDFEWQTLMRKPFIVPESKKINDLLEEFQEKKIHLAVVVDEFGGVAGIVTLEDILEEIVGELNDEFDDDETFYSKLDDNNYVFEAKTSLTDVCRIMNFDLEEFDDVKGETSTLAGLILEIVGKIPSTGEVIRYKNFDFKIEGADKRKIKRVKITRNKTIVTKG
ncbi:MAG: gliding motility-associated protein GldE [Bacteroidia bacterium]